jgi:prepilin-type N-terminal cleavage/methylation domain-containing protein
MRGKATLPYGRGSVGELRVRLSEPRPSGSVRGVTLIELLVAITLLSLLSVGLLMALRLGLNAYGKTQARLMDNRRVAGAQRILEEQLEGLMPIVAACGASASGGGTRMAFFQGEPQVMRLVSTFSLQQAWRGQPQILEVFVIPGADGRGVRLVVNEIPYTGGLGAGQLCMGPGPGGAGFSFLPVTPGPKSFVLADKLAYCRFSYLTPPKEPNHPPLWLPVWAAATWPAGVRVDMAPLDPDPSRLQPIAITAPIHIHRNPEIPYGDFGL